MRKNNLIESSGREANNALSERLMAGAERLIGQANEADLAELLAEYSDRRTGNGKAGVVRTGQFPARKLQTGMGPVTVRIPKVQSRAPSVGHRRNAILYPLDQTSLPSVHQCDDHPIYPFPPFESPFPVAVSSN